MSCVSLCINFEKGCNDARMSVESVPQITFIAPPWSSKGLNSAFIPAYHAILNF